MHALVLDGPTSHDSMGRIGDTANQRPAMRSGPRIE
jgi:hypothetical protein